MGIGVSRALVAAASLLWLAGYALVVARIGNLLRGGPIRRWLDGLTGAALIALGIRLAAEER